MPKKDKEPQKESKAAENYYDLKTDAIERLVNAENAPEVSYKEINKYKSGGGKLRFPSWLKIIFIKFWFGGAVCYFFLWGLGLYISGIDLLFSLSVGLGLVTDLLVNNLLHFFEPTKGEFDKWMMIPFRKFWSLFLNIIYSGAILFCIIWAYNAANTIIVGSPDTTTEIAIGVEPIMFGLLYMGFDMLFILIKNTMKKIVRDAEKKASGGK